MTTEYPKMDDQLDRNFIQNFSLCSYYGIIIHSSFVSLKKRFEAKTESFLLYI